MNQETLVYFYPESWMLESFDNRAFDLPELGLYCPVGKEFIDNYIDFLPLKVSGTHWLFIVRDKKKFMIAVIKYNIDATFVYP